MGWPNELKLDQTYRPFTTVSKPALLGLPEELQGV